MPDCRHALLYSWALTAAALGGAASSITAACPTDRLRFEHETQPENEAVQIDEPQDTPDGWVSIFNGKDLAGWTPKIRGYELGDNFGETFRVEDGVLTVAYDQYQSFEGRFGHLFYEHEYTDYMLRLEYRFTGDQTPGGPGWAFRNSGVMVHGQPAKTMQKDQDFPVSIEVQLLGVAEGHDGKRPTANLCTPGTHVVMEGKLVKRHCTNSTSDTFRGDQWVRVEIEVRGNQLIRHKVNDTVVLEYTKPQLDTNDANTKAWIKAHNKANPDHPLDVMLRSGSISLQAESHPCAFRNIELKVLDPERSSPD